MPDKLAIGVCVQFVMYHLLVVTIIADAINEAFCKFC